MKNIVEVNGVEVFAYHGCMNEEAILGGKYIVDVAISTNFQQAANSDDLNDTLDYVSIRTIIIEEMSIRSKLIEHVGFRILNRIKNTFTPIVSTKIKITKCNPPINGQVKDVAIVIET